MHDTMQASIGNSISGTVASLRMRLRNQMRYILKKYQSNGGAGCIVYPGDKGDTYEDYEIIAEGTGYNELGEPVYRSLYQRVCFTWDNNGSFEYRVINL